MLEIGSVVDGKYKVLNIVGKGGMSVVYLVMNEKANKQWAIKEVRTDGVQDSMVVRQNLMADVNILKNLNHPHLPSIVDIIDRPSEGTFLIVMDYIEGRPLSKLIKESGAQNESDVIEWAKQLCDVFGYLHSRKPPIIYRDMKPSNVMLKPDGNIMVIDFGTAREYKGGKSEDTTLLGTKGYAAPEQYGGNGETDARTDIYNLGATMYHLLTGVNPDPALPPYYGMVPVRQINPVLSYGIEQIVLKCTANRPEDRYQSAAELYYDLENPPTPSPVIKIKWNTFLVSVILTIVMILGTAGFGVAHGVQLSSTYDSYIQKGDGQKETDTAAALEQYKAAIEIDPGNYVAYESILNLYTNTNGDEYITDEEFYVLRKLIKENEDALTSSGNIAAYAENVALPLGEFLAFGHKSNSTSEDGEVRVDDTGIPSSIAYLSVAKDNISDSNKQQIASLIYEMANQYSNVGESETDKFGNTQINVSEYWSKLTELADPNIVELSNPQLAVMIYNNVTSQIVDNYKWFISSDQVTTSEIATVINEIESTLATESIQTNGDAELISQCQSNIAAVRKLLPDESAK